MPKSARKKDALLSLLSILGWDIEDIEDIGDGRAKEQNFLALK
jgi:hypothetical protein